MSWYTIFDEQEAVVTSTTTAAILNPADPVLVHNVATGKKFQTTVGAVACLQAINTTLATSLTTATALAPYGISIISAQATNLTSLGWALADPPVAGLAKTVICASSTSSGLIVTPVSATISTSAGSAGAFLGFGVAGAAAVGKLYVELTSLSTSNWMVTGKSSAATYFA